MEADTRRAVPGCFVGPKWHNFPRQGGLFLCQRYERSCASRLSLMVPFLVVFKGKNTHMHKTAGPPGHKSPLKRKTNASSQKHQASSSSTQKGTLLHLCSHHPHARFWSKFLVGVSQLWDPLIAEKQRRTVGRISKAFRFALGNRRACPRPPVEWTCF